MNDKTGAIVWLDSFVQSTYFYFLDLSISIMLKLIHIKNSAICEDTVNTKAKMPRSVKINITLYC